MTGLTITASDAIKELKIWAATLIAAIVINVYAIIYYDGSWSELYSQFHIVLIISMVLYFLLAIGRLAIIGVRMIFRQ